jgi:hypothetical protein
LGGEDEGEGGYCIRDPHPNPLPIREREVHFGAALQCCVVTIILDIIPWILYNNIENKE